MDNLIAKLYKTKKTVFTTKDIAILWEESRPANLKSKINYYVERGALIRLSRGIFATTEDYNPKELANSIYTPSYISFETVLREAGLIFQHYEMWFLAGPWPGIKKIREHTFKFRKLKDSVLYNPAGINNEGNYNIATPERALLDTLYIFPEYHFDNLQPISWDDTFELVELYNNKQLVERLKKYKQYAQQ